MMIIHWSSEAIGIWIARRQNRFLLIRLIQNLLELIQINVLEQLKHWVFLQRLKFACNQVRHSLHRIVSLIHVNILNHSGNTQILYHISMSGIFSSTFTIMLRTCWQKIIWIIHLCRLRVKHILLCHDQFVKCKEFQPQCTEITNEDTSQNSNQKIPLKTSETNYTQHSDQFDMLLDIFSKKKNSTYNQNSTGTIHMLCKRKELFLTFSARNVPEIWLNWLVAFFQISNPFFLRT